MKGLELARLFYEQHGAPMLEEQFPHLLPHVAVGLCGSGSECFGFDDELSRDHDFEPGFCLFLPDEETVSRRDAFLLERAYAKLPQEFEGYRRAPLSPVGGNRHGVLRMADFFTEKVGCPDGALPIEGWFCVPEQSLAEATNGVVFRDDGGVFTAIRQRLTYLPEEVRLKKLAGHLLLMGQAGQYNFGRCLARGETGAARLAAAEFVKSAMHAVFLLNRAYLPYYKWQFRAMRDLPRLSELAVPLERLLCGGDAADVEAVCAAVAAELRAQGLSDYGKPELEGHAYAVNDRIADGTIRNQHILYGV